MIELKIENVNPKNKKTSDCVIRALSKASNKSYEQVLRELVEITLKTGYMINDKKCYEKWLADNYFIKMPQPKKFDGTKYLVGEINELIKSDDKVVISLAHHLTCVVDNQLIDLWDCRRKTIGNYYIKMRGAK